MECWQYKIRQKKQAEAGEALILTQPAQAAIASIDYVTAKAFILEYEWLGNMGTSKYCYGLFLGDRLSSVVCFGPLVAPTSYRRLLGDQITPRIVQICRGATAYWSPPWVPSMLLARSLKLMALACDAAAAVAYADPRAGEIGTIYQACNAIYLGFTSSGGGKRYFINGRSYDPRKVHKKFGSRAHSHLVKIDPSYSTEPITPKHRYLFICERGAEGQRLLKRVQPFARPYPKRS